MELLPKGKLDEILDQQIKWPLLFTGKVGVGKTYLAAVLCRLWEGPWYMNRLSFALDLLVTKRFEFGATFRDWLYEFFRDEPNQHYFKDGKQLTILRQPKLCVFDDCVIRELTAARFEALADLTDTRQGLPTIYISNVGLEDIQKNYDDRIADRMACGTVVKFDGTSLR